MLSKADIELIRKNREAIAHNRTTPIIAYTKPESGQNPVTGETTYGEPVGVPYDVIWKIPNTGTKKDDELVLAGYTIQLEDRIATFNDPAIDIDAIDYVVHDGKRYTLRATSVVGIGEPNRIECIARLIA